MDEEVKPKQFTLRIRTEEDGKFSTFHLDGAAAAAFTSPSQQVDLVIGVGASGSLVLLINDSFEVLASSSERQTSMDTQDQKIYAAIKKEEPIFKNESLELETEDLWVPAPSPGSSMEERKSSSKWNSIILSDYLMSIDGTV